MITLKAKDVIHLLSQVSPEEPVFMPVLWLKEDIESNWSITLTDEQHAKAVSQAEKQLSEYWYEEANNALTDAIEPYLPADSEWVA